MRIKRAMNIAWMGLLRIYSPSLMRRVKISDIWKTPNYLGGSGNLIDFISFTVKEAEKEIRRKR